METSEKLQRVIAFLNRDDIDYLDKIGKDALFTKGVKLSRVKVIRAMVEAMKELKVNGRDISSEEELKEEILEKLTQFKPGTLK
ncbi:hypothetical protein ACFL3N_01660 [Candidatus Omnitrophota bacterium]